MRRNLVVSALSFVVLFILTGCPPTTPQSVVGTWNCFSVIQSYDIIGDEIENGDELPGTTVMCTATFRNDGTLRLDYSQGGFLELFYAQIGDNVQISGENFLLQNGDIWSIRQTTDLQLDDNRHMSGSTTKILTNSGLSIWITVCLSDEMVKF